MTVPAEGLKRTINPLKRKSTLYDPSLEFCCPVFAYEYTFRGCHGEIEQQSFVKPYGHVGYTYSVYKKLFVDPEKIIRIQCLRYLVKRAVIGIFHAIEHHNLRVFVRGVEICDVRHPYRKQLVLTRQNHSPYGFLFI